MKKLLLLTLLLPLFCNAQKIKGVVTYLDIHATKKPNFGEQVYLISCNGCTSDKFIFITSYTLSNMLISQNEISETLGGETKGVKVSSDTLKMYKQRIDALISKSKISATVDASGNYSIEKPPKGKYLILAECQYCDAYKCKIVEIKGNEVINFDANFLCF